MLKVRYIIRAMMERTTVRVEVRVRVRVKVRVRVEVWGYEKTLFWPGDKTLNQHGLI